jgi:hypothetical protein
MTVKTRSMPVEGCIQNYGPPDVPPPKCVPVLVDVDWAAKGVRVRSFDTEHQWTRLTHDTKPPQRSSQVGKGVGADYTASQAMRVRVVTADDSKEVLWTGSIPCNVTADGCMFTVTQSSSRTNAPV